MKVVLINLFTVFCFSMVFAPIVYKFVKIINGGQNILSYVENHKSKQGTLSCGGIIFIVGAVFGYFIFVDNEKSLSTILILSFLAFGLLGFLDDFIKIRSGTNEGLKAYQKFIGQIGIASILSVYVYNSIYIGSGLLIPFTNVYINIGFWIIPFVILFIVAVVNSVNLIDGLDGLAGGVSTVFIIAFIIILQLLINNLFVAGENASLLTEYQNINIVSGGLLGGVLAFLLLNSHPAKMFMGDTGSLALGGFLACILAFTRQYLLIFIIGVAFVITTLSVILQVGYYKITKKRIFKMAPIHHHFEAVGMNETKIVAIYIIVTMIISFLAISIML